MSIPPKLCAHCGKPINGQRIPGKVREVADGVWRALYHADKTACREAAGEEKLEPGLKWIKRSSN